MGSNVPFRVKVLLLEESVIEVFALTSEEALEIASQIPGVAKALEVVYDFEEEQE